MRLQTIFFNIVYYYIILKLCSLVSISFLSLSIPQAHCCAISIFHHLCFQ